MKDFWGKTVPLQGESTADFSHTSGLGVEERELLAV